MGTPDQLSPDPNMSSVRRFNILIRERDEKIAEANGWLACTDPVWRADWRRRMEGLLAEIEHRSRDASRS